MFVQLQVAVERAAMVCNTLLTPSHEWHNPFRGLLPRPEPFCEGDFWHTNGFYALFPASLPMS